MSFGRFGGAALDLSDYVRRDELPTSGGGGVKKGTFTNSGSAYLQIGTNRVLPWRLDPFHGGNPEGWDVSYPFRFREEGRYLFLLSAVNNINLSAPTLVQSSITFKRESGFETVYKDQIEIVDTSPFTLVNTQHLEADDEVYFGFRTLQQRIGFRGGAVELAVVKL